MTHPEVIFSMRTCRLFGSDGRPIPHDEGISWGSIWHIPAHTNRMGAQSGGDISGGRAGDNSALKLPRCVRIKVMDVGWFLAPSE